MSKWGKEEEILYIPSIEVKRNSSEGDGREREKESGVSDATWIFVPFIFFFLISSKIYNNNNNKWNTLERKEKQMNDEVNQGHDKCKSFKAFFFLSYLYINFLFTCRCVLPPLLLYKNVFLSWYLTRQHHTHFLYFSFFCCYFAMMRIQRQTKTKEK